jgi:hypothetical protein
MMHNMCSATFDAGAAFARAPVGVLGFVHPDGTPRACAVSPYVDGPDALVTSTLAYLGKVTALQRDPRAALLAGGAEVRGVVDLQLDLTARSFDRHVRAQELAAYPPSRSILRIPGHRRLFPWYVGRALVRLPLHLARPVPGSDRVTVTVVADGVPRIHPLAPDLAVEADVVELGAEVGEGAACLLVHEEDGSMADLRQVRILGSVRAGRMTVRHRSGSLAPAATGTVDQLRGLRDLARTARRSRPTAERLARELAGAPSVGHVERAIRDSRWSGP